MSSGQRRHKEPVWVHPSLLEQRLIFWPLLGSPAVNQGRIAVQTGYQNISSSGGPLFCKTPSIGHADTCVTIWTGGAYLNIAADCWVAYSLSLRHSMWNFTFLPVTVLYWSPQKKLRPTLGQPCILLQPTWASSSSSCKQEWNAIPQHRLWWDWSSPWGKGCLECLAANGAHTRLLTLPQCSDSTGVWLFERGVVPSELIFRRV